MLNKSKELNNMTNPLTARELRGSSNFDADLELTINHIKTMIDEGMDNVSIVEFFKTLGYDSEASFWLIDKAKEIA